MENEDYVREAQEVAGLWSIYVIRVDVYRIKPPQITGLA